MKKLAIIGIICLLAIGIFLSGCASKPAAETPNSAAETPSTVNSDVIPTRLGCGDKICAEDELCDEATHRTICPEDCGIKCGAYVNILSPTCEGECSVSGNTITVKGSSLIKIPLENIGEASTDLINTNFKCDYADGSGLYFKTELGDKNGYLWGDYFEGGDEQESVNSAITGNNKLNYILSLQGSTDDPIDLLCRTGFSSSTFNTAQVANYNINFR